MFEVIIFFVAIFFVAIVGCTICNGIKPPNEDEEYETETETEQNDIGL